MYTCIVSEIFFWRKKDKLRLAAMNFRCVKDNATLC